MDKTPKRGRPPKPEGEARTKTIQAKLTPAERAEIDAVTDRPSEWAREVLLRAARRAAKRS